jgi:hypothetical protein
MKIISLLPALAIFAGSLALTSCQTAAPYEQSVLVEAGFQPVLPETISERDAYQALPANKVERTTAPGRSVYAYRAKDATYIGGESEYKRYQDLLQKKGRERADNVAMQMNQDALHALH